MEINSIHLSVYSPWAGFMMGPETLLTSPQAPLAGPQVPLEGPQASVAGGQTL